MATPTPNESRQPGRQPEALDEHLLDAGYAYLAAVFKNEVANTERRTARGNHTSRREP
ncbi:hypothetical protein [Mycolicibacterium gadium]|uniref:hypothetical protein n=1 Tax=Mycolicibacterium gadium TaxID=1794 RepID=UPI0015D39D70|nr:hypothetical protein [Mycolicibacterium gadium]